MGRSKAQQVVAGEVARRLRDLRATEGWSREKAAREASRRARLEISHETVRRAEAGERVPSFRTMEALAAAYKVSIWDIYPVSAEVRASIGYSRQTASDQPVLVSGVPSSRRRWRKSALVPA